MVNTHLVTWQEFMREKENKNLTITEAKQKYLKLQQKFNLLMEAEVAAYNAVALNSVVDGSQGGPSELLNPITNIVFSAAPTGTVAGFTAGITLTFTYPTLVVGAPTFATINSQAGGGVDATDTFTYYSGSGTKSLVFQKTQAANTDGALDIGAGKLTNRNFASGSGYTVANNLVGVDTAQAAITGVSGTYIAGGSGASGEDVVLTVAIQSDGVVTSAQITSIASAATAYFVPGDTITIDFSELTGTNASSGAVVYTIASAGLIGDTLTLPTAIASPQNGYNSNNIGIVKIDESNYITTSTGQVLGQRSSPVGGFLTYSTAVLGAATVATA